MGPKIMDSLDALNDINNPRHIHTRVEEVSF